MLSVWAKGELLTSSCCRERDGGVVNHPDSGKSFRQQDEKVLELNLSLVNDLIDEEFIRNTTKDYKYIALTITEVSELSQELCSWIITYVTPKLYELTIEDCSALSWKGYVKKFVDKATSIEVINFRRNAWVNDFVVEQLSIKFSKTLRVLDLEYNDITDLALHHVGRRCLQLRSICLKCCPKITDIGLVELSRRLHLSNIDISHNVNITDGGIEVLLSTPAHLDEVKLTNCPKLTDRSIETMYEALALWGKKRNLKAQKLRYLELRDNMNFTAQVMVWLSATAQSLVTLDLRDSTAMDLTKGLREISLLGNLQNLYLGPTTEIPVEPDSFVESMSILMPRLVTLHLTDIVGLEDEDVAEILESAKVLDDLYIHCIEVGTSTIEALCSNVPNISKAHLSRTSLLQDKDIRCLTQVCAKMTSLTLQQCELLSDNAFQRSLSLNKLTNLDVSNLSYNFDGSLLQFFRCSPLTRLCLDGLRVSNIRSLLPALPVKTQVSMRELSFRSCPKLSVEDIEYILSHYPLCKSFDFTNSLGVQSQFDPQFNSPNPLLTFTVTSEFTGFKHNKRQSLQLHKFLTLQSQFLAWRAARKIARLRLLRMATMQARGRWKEFFKSRRIEGVIVKLQSRFRARRVQRVAQNCLRAALVMTRFARKLQTIREKKKEAQAYRHARRSLQRKVFRAMAGRIAQMHSLTMQRHDRLVICSQIRLLRRMLYTIMIACTDHQDLEICAYARVFWEKNVLRNILRCWRSIIGSRELRNVDYAKIVTFGFPLSFDNSFRQLRLVELADAFQRRRLLMPAWICLCDDILQARIAEAKMPKAIAHYDNTFFNRVIPPIFASLVWYRKERKMKIGFKVVANRQYVRYRLRKGLFRVIMNTLRCQDAKRWMVSSKHHYRIRKQRLPFTQEFYWFTASSIFCKEAMRKFPTHCQDRLVRLSWPQWEANKKRSLEWKIMTHKAERHLARLYRKKYFYGWKDQNQKARHSEEYYAFKYERKFLRKVFGRLKLWSEKNQEYKNAVRTRLAATAKDADDLENKIRKAFENLVRFQAHVRGGQCRKSTRIYRIESVFAALNIQKTVRRFLAVKAYKRMLRRRGLTERQEELAESVLMRKEDEDTFYYMYHVKNAIHMQRVFRGWKGRVRAAYLAAARFRNKQSDFYATMERIRLLYENTLKAIAAKNRFRAQSATMIQKRIRGILARKYVLVLRREKAQHLLVVCIQCAYRQRICRQRLEALRRHHIVLKQVHKLRRERGLFLRMMGLGRKKKFHEKMRYWLDALGIEPLSFNFYPSSLVMETFEDFRRFTDVVVREVKVYRHHLFDPIGAERERRRQLVGLGKTLDVGDCVRITDPEHQYCGYTGVLVRIDPSVIGEPLYEVKLDGFHPRIDYVRMTIDAIEIYSGTNLPLKRFEAHPKLKVIKHPFAVFGFSPGDPLFSKKNIKAAWKIQGAFRQYRARKLLARKRFEFWVKEAAIHGSMIKHLADMNSLSMGGYNLIRKVGGVGNLRRRKEVAFTSVTNELIPPRLLVRRNHQKAERTLIEKEVQKHMKSREAVLSLAYDENKQGFFTIGFQRMTQYGKGQMLMRSTFGLASKTGGKGICGGSSRLVFGSRGAQALTRKRTTVTGMDAFKFSQFDGSPHVRYAKLSLYQGEWAGIPLVTALRPHGEGVVMFLEGWGFSREDKLLKLTIKQCRYLLSNLEGEVDPYCEVICNQSFLQTSIKKHNSDPIFQENFEIDVTNPLAELNIIVRDRPLTSFNRGAFLGQIFMKVGNYSDGIVHEETHQLVGANRTRPDKSDRGEITISVQWTNRMFEDDMENRDMFTRKILKIQNFFRMMQAKRVQRQYRSERVYMFEIANEAAAIITGAIRMRISQRLIRRLRRMNLAALRIQMRLRMFLSKCRVYRKRIERAASIIIQCRIRLFLAKRKLVQLRIERTERLRWASTEMQRWVRRLNAQCSTWRERRVMQGLLPESDDEEEEEGKGDENEEGGGSAGGSDKGEGKEEKEERNENTEENLVDSQSAARSTDSQEDIDAKTNRAKAKAKRRAAWLRPLINKHKSVSEWIDSYGTDPIYHLKRSRRIMDRGLRKLLSTKYALIMTRFGRVYIHTFPVPNTQEDTVRELNNEPPLCNRHDFVLVYFPSFDVAKTPRLKAVEMIQQHPHTAYLHLPTSVKTRESIMEVVVKIQCASRQRRARRGYRKLLRARDAFAKLQRRFRARYVIYNRAASWIVALFHFGHSKRIARHRRREKKMAIRIQCAFRMYMSKCTHFNLRCVREVSVLKFSHAAPVHDPARILDGKYDTFWVAENKDLAEIRFEMRKRERLSDIYILASTFSASPEKVSVYAVLEKTSKQFEPLVENALLPLLRGRRWHRLEFPPTFSKYFKVSFSGNYGHKDVISVRQIRFVRCKEKSVTITEQPEQHILTEGPAVKNHTTALLKCLADGWPYPTYQWYRGKTPIPGATKNYLELKLGCYPTKKYSPRFYRCSKCRLVSHEVPFNAYHVECGECHHKLTHREIIDYDNMINEIKRLEDEILPDHQEKLDIVRRLEEKKLREPKNVDLAMLLASAQLSLRDLENRLLSLRTERMSLKKNMRYAVRYNNEGIYSCCVQNTRGGVIVIQKRTSFVAVTIDRPKPYIMRMLPDFNPRKPVIRKVWTIYQSMLGTFYKGRTVGMVTIRYLDGSYYEGPYVSEDWLDLMGCVPPDAREKNHYGIFTCKDGRKFEGQNVDNHFDPNNLQTFYRVTFPTGDKYEGKFVDEDFHGIGLYSSPDGTTYEGGWHRGSKFGHGHLRHADGWTYEGDFIHGKRQGEGTISWDDGSCYIGLWREDTREGSGVYLSALRDLYKGDFSNNQFHGFGDMIYSSGAKYVGEFRNGVRHGRGIFTDIEGNEFYGIFENDIKDGEFLVKEILALYGKGQPNYEIKIGLWERGTFVKWLVQFSNKMLTRQFIKIFKENRDMFDSAYGKMVAANLPTLPHGVDQYDEEVQEVVEKLRTEAGVQVPEDKLIAAHENVAKLVGQIIITKKQIESLRERQSQLDVVGAIIYEQVSELKKQFTRLFDEVEREDRWFLQFWYDDKQHTEKKFWAAVRELEKFVADDFFVFRNHRIPPPYAHKITKAINMLFGLPPDAPWPQLQMVIADFVHNRRENDESALINDYSCKLLYLMKDYKVLDHCIMDIKTEEDLLVIIHDPRFRPDSYYVESLGNVAPSYVVWIKACYAYLKAAQTIHQRSLINEQKRMNAYRIQNQHVKRNDEYLINKAETSKVENALKEAEENLLQFESAHTQGLALVKFMEETMKLFKDKEPTLDYYQEMEKRIQEQKDRFESETLLRVMVSDVEDRVQNDRAKAAKSKSVAPDASVIYEALDPSSFQIREWLCEQLRVQQKALLDSGYTLGYSYGRTPESPLSKVDFQDIFEIVISSQETQSIIDTAVNTVISMMNEAWNEPATKTAWRMNTGREISQRFLYVLAWQFWADEAREAEDKIATDAWGAIFPDPVECARRAVEARYNFRMTRTAREQGKVWGRRHPHEIAATETVMSEEFPLDYPDDTAEWAIKLSEEFDNRASVPNAYFDPTTTARCFCWMRLHPVEIREARDAKMLTEAKEFEGKYPNEFAEKAFNILHGVGTEEDLRWAGYANSWKTYNLVTYNETSEKLIDEMASDFVVKMKDLSVVDQAAMIVENERLAKEILDPDIRNQYKPSAPDFLRASCWATRNQGYFKAAVVSFRAEQYSRATRHWNEFTLETDQLQKGSYMYTTEAQQADPRLDRFFNFRRKLLVKHAWFYGFLCKAQADVIKELRDLENSDPTVKIYFKVRPTDEQKVRKDDAEKFRHDKKRAEMRYSELASKLSAWNTFFGPFLDGQYTYSVEAWGTTTDDAAAAVVHTSVTVTDGVSVLLETSDSTKNS